MGSAGRRDGCSAVDRFAERPMHSFPLLLIGSIHTGDRVRRISAQSGWKKGSAHTVNTISTSGDYTEGWMGVLCCVRVSDRVWYIKPRILLLLLIPEMFSLHRSNLQPWHSYWIGCYVLQTPRSAYLLMHVYAVHLTRNSVLNGRLLFLVFFLLLFFVVFWLSVLPALVLVNRRISLHRIYLVLHQHRSPSWLFLPDCACTYVKEALCLEERLCAVSKE